MRRRQVPLVEFSGNEPPEELLWFCNGGGPWTAEGFAAFLRARAAWRDTHDAPLPALPTRERVALTRMPLPRALVDVEQGAKRSATPLPYRSPGPVVDRPVARRDPNREDV